MTVPRLSAEQRRALAMLATAGRDGVTQGLLSSLGFDAITGLVDKGLVTLTSSKVRAPSKMIEDVRVRIKAAGRKALAAED
jgi:hypothetical protein